MVNILLALKASDKQSVLRMRRWISLALRSVEDRAKDGEEIPIRAIMMMKRKTNDDEEVYR